MYRVVTSYFWFNVQGSDIYFECVYSVDVLGVVYRVIMYGEECIVLMS